MVQAVRTTRVRGDETRARILVAAMNLFATQGLEATSVRAIARACGITDAALYYHFPCKQDMVEAIWAERLTAPLPLATPLTLTREQVRMALEQGFAFWINNELLSRVLWRLALENDPGAIELRNRSLRANRENLEPVLTTLYGERGTLMAEAMIAMLSGIAMSAMLQYGPDYAAVVRQPAFRGRVSTLIDTLLPECAVRESRPVA